VSHRQLVIANRPCCQGPSVPTGELGLLLISGDSALAYYWNKHEKTKDTVKSRWVVTGDTYYQDEDGYYWYAGSADDICSE
jgi:acyl-coenzyme A synthetase/AMP-(fatty) acid ligase